MSLKILKPAVFGALLAGLCAGHASAQSTNASVNAVVRGVEAREAEVLAKAGTSFRQGLVNLRDGQRDDARQYFDDSIEAFLGDGVKGSRVTACYRELVDTIFLLEFPNPRRRPAIVQLVGTCGWKIEPELADIGAAAPVAPAETSGGQDAQGGSPSQPGGFAEQRHEVSPLDELARLELTADEADVDSPQAQRQFQLIEAAVSNKSLGFSFQVHPMIQQFINYYQGRGRSTMTSGLYRSGMFMRMARRIFREEGVPENVAWLGQVESAWKPTALSWAAASGLWQFIPSTGERFGLRRTAHVDERNGFEGATRASARYLKFLANRYNGNWELALAAYNSGEGNVDRAIARAGVSNFWMAYPYLPRETRNYVPNILATILIANNPAQYGFGQVRPAAPLLWDRVRVPAATNLSLLAQAADTTVEYLRYLNPELRSNQTPPEPYIVRVPPTKGDEILAMFKRLPASRRGDVSLVASVSGETWQNIANRTGVSLEDLKAANPGMTVPQGKVIVPVNPGIARTTYQRPSAPTAAPLTEGFRTVKVKKGDTLTAIAKRHGVSASEIANMNGLSSVGSPLTLGRELKIPVK